MTTQIDTIIEAAKPEMSDNPHKMRTDRLFFAIANLAGRREALEEVQRQIRDAADNIQAVLLSPTWPLAGHGFHDQGYSKVTTCALVANFRASVREVELETQNLRVAKAAHRTVLERFYARAA